MNSEFNLFYVDESSSETPSDTDMHQTTSAEPSLAKINEDVEPVEDGDNSAQLPPTQPTDDNVTMEKPDVADPPQQ